MPNNEQMTFGEHLEVLRRMLLRILLVGGLIAAVIFCFKETTFDILLAPSEYDFCTYRAIESLAQTFGIDFHFEPFHVDLISTELSSQFMTHIAASCYLGLLGASPFILYELFRFISPALHDNERKHSKSIVAAIYTLFLIGILTSYFILFPISFRFLGTYSVSDRIHTAVTLDSYISTFTTLTLVMGMVFQLPIISFALAKMRLVSSTMLRRYRKHAFLIIAIVAAIITPPDVMTLILVAIPIYLLYELSIKIVKMVNA